MRKIASHINPETKSTLDALTATLLYEGYSLFPYHRSAIKNQKPIPFGVVYPANYHVCNQHAPAKMEAQCIVTGNENLEINVEVVFLHLTKSDNNEWKTIERRLEPGDFRLAALQKGKRTISFRFEVPDAGDNTSNEIMPINGELTIEAENIGENSYRAAISIDNATPIQNPLSASRDEALRQSFLATHIVLSALHGEFISAQGPPEKYRAAVEACGNSGLWQIMIDRENTSILFSPIIVHDYPKIHPRSKTDLFDSTEIQEALMLHLAVMSGEEKNRIAESDEKLRAMLNKAAEATPDDIIALHGGMYDDEQYKNDL
jgi:hypothetical protein